MAHIFWQSVLAFYLTFFSDILFWHPIWHPFWHPIWHPFWHQSWHFLWHSIWHSFSYSIWHLFWHSFWHLFWHSVWHCFLARKQPDICHILRHSFWHMYLAYLLTFFLAFYLVTWCIFGDSLCRSGGEHFDPELAVEVRHPELAVQVRRGTLRSIAWSWGLAGIALIQRLLFGSGGDTAI